MWKEKFTSFQRRFPDAVKLNQPATDSQISKLEDELGLNLEEVDPGWMEFLRFSNGASVLSYNFSGVESKKISSISDLNKMLWDIPTYSWAKEHFLGFFGDASPMNIGFFREDNNVRCVALLTELTDTYVLPIASNFDNFVTAFIQDAESALISWKPVPGKKFPYVISEEWPLDLKSWCKRDKVLRMMLKSGELNDLFKNNADYCEIVERVLQS
jgi:hypothetical protein